MFNKINENTFLKSTLILLLGGILGKIVGFILRIIVIRNLSTTAIGLYSMLSPTTALLTTIAVFSYSNAISKYISDSSSRAKSLFISIIPISILINSVIILFICFISKYLAINLLKEENLYLPIICISLTMPFMSVSAIIKGYFWGKQNMSPYILSNFIEQIVRLVIIVFFIKRIIIISEIYAICFIILVNTIGEVSSQIVMMKYMPKIMFNKYDFRFDLIEIKKIYKYCIPATMSKILGSISYFLEPIIITNILLYVGYSKSYIVYEYGVLNAYALSLLLMPQFFTQNMSTSLIPELSKNYMLKNYDLCIKRIRQIVLYSVIIGLISTIIIVLFPKEFLNILYKTNIGVDYIYLLAPFTILFYIEGPLVNSISAIGDTKRIFRVTLITSIVRVLSIIFFSLLKIGMYSLVISIIINLLLSTYLYYKELKKLF